MLTCSCMVQESAKDLTVGYCQIWGLPPFQDLLLQFPDTRSSELSILWQLKPIKAALQWIGEHPHEKRHINMELAQCDFLFLRGWILSSFCLLLAFKLLLFTFCSEFIIVFRAKVCPVEVVLQWSQLEIFGLFPYSSMQSHRNHWKPILTAEKST